MTNKIYQVASDPYLDDDNRWALDIYWVNAEEQKKGEGTIYLPFREVAYELQKYFRTNVNPLGPEELKKIIEKSIKGTVQ